MENIDLLIEQFIGDEIFLDNYTKTDNLSCKDYDPKLTIKIGKRINKNIKLILQSEDGITRFKKLLNHDAPIIQFVAARYLFPVMGDESINIMKNYRNSLNDKIKQWEIDNLIASLKQKQNVITAQYNDIYGKEVL